MRRQPSMLAGACALATLAGAATQAPAAAAPEAPGPAVKITLVTGDTALVRTSNGRAVAAQVSPGRGRGHVTFSIERARGSLYAIPADARPLLKADRLDLAFFNLTRLIEWRYDDAHLSRLPVITQGGAAISAATVSDTIPELGMRVQQLPKKDAHSAWRGLTRGAASQRLGAGVSRLWLDGLNQIALDRSVRQIGAPRAWAKGLTGKGVTVAVLDTGIDARHPDFAGNKIRIRRDFSGSASGIQDKAGHGTHVAGIVAGTGSASRGKYKGVAPGARLAIGKVLDDSGSGRTSWVIKGMTWAATNVKAPIVNLSLGHRDEPGIDAAEKAVADLTRRTGALFVVASGNLANDWESTCEPYYTLASPGSADAALTVGAVDRANGFAGFSSSGPRFVNSAIKPDVTAPGVGIWAPRARGTLGDEPHTNHYAAISGTSMATPHVAGAAAILRQQHPRWRATLLKDAVAGTSLWSDGSIWRQGNGRIDVGRMVSQGVYAGPANRWFYWRTPGAHTVTRIVTFRNTTRRAVTLKLALGGGNGDGGPLPRGFITLGRRTLTVAAGRTATVKVTVRTARVPRHVYAAWVSAESADRKVQASFIMSVQIGPGKVPADCGLSRLIPR